jgi:tetratricopeptide (TPR) repeat protein
VAASRACVGPLAVLLLAAACVSHRAPAGSAAASPPAARSGTEGGSARRPSIGTAMPAMTAGTLESLDPELRDALAGLAVARTPAAHRRVAEAYRRLAILDAAYNHFAAARALDARDAAAYEGLARIWRDWGVPERAMRAVYYAPESASACNTFGTVLHALGQRDAARAAFERATTLEPAAAYAWTNLCYVSFQGGDTAAAVAACGRAVELEPSLAAAHNDLGLAYAAAGDFERAAAAFSAAGDAATGEFNMGIVLVATRNFAAAARAFDRAATLRPAWAEARARAEQSRRLGAAETPSEKAKHK